MPADRSYALTRATSYSTCLAAAAAGAAQRGVVHSVFYAAANIVFPGGLVLSLNAADSTRMPNGLELSNSPGTFPFTILRPGMPVLLGAQRLHIESAHCSLDLSSCTQWNPHITRPVCLDRHNIVKNREWLARYLSTNPVSTSHTLVQSLDLSSFFADNQLAALRTAAMLTRSLPTDHRSCQSTDPSPQPMLVRLRGRGQRRPTHTGIFERSLQRQRSRACKDDPGGSSYGRNLRL